MSTEVASLETAIAESNGGGNGNEVTVQHVKTAGLERVVLAQGVKQPSKEKLERYLGILDSYAVQLQERIETDIQKADQELRQSQKRGVKAEMGEPYSTAYKWWDIFALGPIQGLSLPPYGPHKIFAGGEPTIFFVFVVTNPMPLMAGPSATTVMAGKPYKLRLTTMNVTSVNAGPSLEIDSVFPGTPVQGFLFIMNQPTPAQGRPEIVEFNVTADVSSGFSQPMAAFATNIIDVDFDPGFPAGVAQGPHIHVEQPMRCLCYNP